VVEVPFLAGVDRLAAAGARRFAGVDDGGDGGATALVVVAPAAAGGGAGCFATAAAVAVGHYANSVVTPSTVIERTLPTSRRMTGPP